MQPLWTVAEAVAATGGRAVALAEKVPLTAVSIDSREIAPGALFVAIKGDTLDGHDYVEKALEAGAGAALVSEAWYGAHGGSGLIVVADTLEALRELGRAARARSRAFIVAVTGSAGKTTTKEAIRTVLEAAGATHSSIRSFNNHWGVPLTLARMPRDAQFGVFEIGMNHAGEITPLVKMVRPHVAVVTTVAAAHLEFFPSVEAIAEAKAEIFAGVEPDGVAVLNGDHEHVQLLVKRAQERGIARIETYGYGPSADWRIGPPERAEAGTVARVEHDGDGVDLDLRVSGRHMVANATAAFVVGQVAGVEASVALAALRQFAAPEGRGEVTRLGARELPLLLVDESYNANVASMNAALDVFATIAPPGGIKVLVLGDMRELGEQSPELHRSLKAAVLATGADRIFLVGTAMDALAEALGEDGYTAKAERVEDVIGPVLTSLALGDAVMIKGSNGVRLALLVEQIKQQFSAAS